MKIFILFLFLFIPLAAFTPGTPKVIHVYVALCDNVNQGIVPVPARLGKGDDPANNLYWGAAFGVKTFFNKQPEWKLVTSVKNHSKNIVERCLFRHKTKNVWLVADAYFGIEIKKCIKDFFESASGGNMESIQADSTTTFSAGGAANLIAFVGHDGLMDFSMDNYPVKKNENKREVIILACISKNYFKEGLRKSGAFPLVWTTGLMAPEAYTLHASVNSWLAGEKSDSTRLKAAQAYSKYQNCSINAAKNLLVTGW